jgi:hypothetical protein
MTRLPPTAPTSTPGSTQPPDPRANLTRRQADTRAQFADREQIRARGNNPATVFARYTSGGAIVRWNGQEIRASIWTNGLLKPGQVVPVTVDGGGPVVHGMPKMRHQPEAQAPVAKTFGKLKILYIDDGALWIGGDRRIPKRLSTSLNIDSALTFNNLGDGDKYILSGFDPVSQGVATIRDGGETLAPNGFMFSVTDSASFFPPNYFSAPNGLGHGLFINNSANSGATAIYWDGGDSGSISNPDYADGLGQDAGSGNWWIAPGVSRPVTYDRFYQASGVPDDDSNRWGFFFVSANLDSIAVWNYVDISAGVSGPIFIEHYIYRRSTGQMVAFDGLFNFRQPSNISNFANWVGDRVYGILQTEPIHFDFVQDRDMPISIWQETAGQTISYQSADTISTRVYAIPDTAVVRAYSYHP